MLHSCGDTHELMPDLPEMGLDILDSMQPEPPGMDPETIRRQCIGKLAFNGLLSAQQTLIHGSEAECRAQARFLVDTVGKGGGFFLCTSQALQIQAPIENVLGAYEEALGVELIQNR